MQMQIPIKLNNLFEMSRSNSIRIEIFHKLLKNAAIFFLERNDKNNNKHDKQENIKVYTLLMEKKTNCMMESKNKRKICVQKDTQRMVKRRRKGHGKTARSFRSSFVFTWDKEAKEKKRKLSRSQFICERRFRGPLRRVSGLPAA